MGWENDLNVAGCWLADSSWSNVAGVPIKSGTCGDWGFDPNSTQFNSVMK